MCVAGNKKRKLQQAKEHKSAVKELYKWWRQVDTQDTTHMEQEEVTECWKVLKEKVTTEHDLEDDMEAFSLMSALRFQYESFTERAKRRR